jgi:hypothetical protein
MFQRKLLHQKTFNSFAVDFYGGISKKSVKNIINRLVEDGDLVQNAESE